MNKSTFISSLFFILHLGITISCFANNITVSAITLTNRNTVTQTLRVNCNLTWENSWRTTSAPFNWDAAWVFVKYKVGNNGTWMHATLATSGHTIPSVATSTQTDATGIFIYRSTVGTGSFSPSGIQLQWNYGSDGVPNDAKIYVKVFAIEMVYHPPGSFQAGSGGQNAGELRIANDISSSGTATTFTITGSLPTFQSNSSSSSATNIAAYNNIASDLAGTTTASLNAGFPTGFNAFYSMKYEISQQQYVEFLNTLTYTQQTIRTTSPPNSTPGTGALINPNNNRNAIDIKTSGVAASSIPAIYACDLNGNSNYNEAADGQRIACNYLSWDDLTAYLDWACLRPMTELEYEKICRGNQPPLASEYPWGGTSATAATGLTNDGSINEIASNAGANIALSNSYSSGPLRTGSFATGSSSRSSSGAGYYGNMDLGGNLWERVVTIGTSDGRTFSATNGNGTLTSSGASDVSGWPAATGSGWKGGSWLNTTTGTANTSNRTSAANTDNIRSSDAGGRGVRSCPSLWSPMQLNPALWLDAADASTLTLVSSAVSQWNDKSGNGRNVSQGTSAQQPLYINGALNGLNILRFNGSTNYLINTSVGLSTGSSARTMFVVYTTKAISANKTCDMCGQGNNSTTTGAWFMLQYRNTGAFTGDPYFAGYNADLYDGVSPTVSTKIASINYNGTSGILRRNGTTIASGNRSLNTLGNSFFVGVSPNTISEWLLGDVAEILFFSSSLSSANAQIVEGYLAWKWGLQDNLPSGHPFRYYPPY